MVIFAHLIQTASSLPTDASALESSISALESSISALESEVKALESSSVPWEYSVWVFTFWVVVGVVMELWVIWHEYGDDMEAWALAHFGVFRSPDRPSTAKLVVEIVSVSLIALGVAGELGVGIKITSINGQIRGKSAELRSKSTELRSKSDQLLALVTQQAGDAKDSAKTAREEVDAVGEKAAALMTELGKAEGKLRQLQIFALARHISDTDALVGALTPFKGRQVVLRSYVGDAEGWLFCVSLLHVVQKAQMNATNQCGHWPFDAGKPVTGLNISGPDSFVVAEAIVDKGRTTGGAVATDGPAPLLIFAGIKNPFWLPEQALAAPPQQKSKRAIRHNRR